MSEDKRAAADAAGTVQQRPAAAPELPRTVSSIQLLGARRELLIEHNGERYSLRVTSKGKLILTK